VLTTITSSRRAARRLIAGVASTPHESTGVARKKLRLAGGLPRWGRGWLACPIRRTPNGLAACRARVQCVGLCRSSRESASRRESHHKLARRHAPVRTNPNVSSSSRAHVCSQAALTPFTIGQRISAYAQRKRRSRVQSGSGVFIFGRAGVVECRQLVAPIKRTSCCGNGIAICLRRRASSTA
jgi:hypothetical protein